MIEAAIGISLVLNYVLREHLGIISGGFVVPAYLAMFAYKPGRIGGTFFIAFLAFLTIKLLRNFMFIYGRRTLMLCLIIGFYYNYLFYKVLGEVAYFARDPNAYQLNVIGSIIPGIIAYWMEEQGPVRTLSVLWINAVMTCLIIMLIFGRIFAI